MQQTLGGKFRTKTKYWSEEKEPKLYNRIKGPIDFESSEWKELSVSDEGKRSNLFM